MSAKLGSTLTRLWTVYSISHGKSLLYIGISSRYSRRKSEHLYGKCRTTRETITQLTSEGEELTFTELDAIQGYRNAIARESDLRRTLRPMLNALPSKDQDQ